MATNLLTIAVVFVLSVGVVSIGSYIGALRALEVYHGPKTSVFLDDDRGR